MKYTLLKESVRINKTKEVISKQDNPDLYQQLRKKAILALNRQEKNSCLRELGLSKVKGKPFWE